MKEVREFLGLAGYYRRFVPNFARVAGQLHSLTRQEVSFHWTGECQQSFDRLKQLLSEPPVLAYPDFARPFTLHTDASGKGLGAVLEQEGEKGKITLWLMLAVLCRSMRKIMGSLTWMP